MARATWAQNPRVTAERHARNGGAPDGSAAKRVLRGHPIWIRHGNAHAIAHVVFDVLRGHIGSVRIPRKCHLGRGSHSWCLRNGPGISAGGLPNQTHLAIVVGDGLLALGVVTVRHHRARIAPLLMVHRRAWHGAQRERQPRTGVTRTKPAKRPNSLPSFADRCPAPCTRGRRERRPLALAFPGSSETPSSSLCRERS